MIEPVEVPDLEEFLHLVAQAQRIVGLYQAGKDEQDANEGAGDRDK